MKQTILLLLAAVLFLTGELAGAQNKYVMGEFSADSTKVMQGKTVKSKIFVQRDKIREEATEGNKTAVTIIRLDKKVTWILQDDKTYLEMKNMDQANTPQAEEEAKKIADVKELGKETVNGYVCRVIQYTYKNKSQGVLTVWLAEKLNYNIKMEHKIKDKMQMSNELTNIKEGKLAASLFEIPPGYKSLDLLKGLELPF
jgi:hypothetical protein